MKLWILSPTEKGWENLIDYCEAKVIVRAESEIEARQLAIESTCWGFWSKPSLAECRELNAEGEREVIVESLVREDY